MCVHGSLYDTRGTRLEAIRDKLSLDASTTRLYNRPYVVSDINRVMQMAGDQANLNQWLASHDWSELGNRVNALQQEDEEGRRKLPNSQMHSLRESLFMGRAGADGQYALIRKRYADKGITQIEATENSLFWQDAISHHHVTGLLDAMDAADFWQSLSDQAKTVVEEA